MNLYKSIISTPIILLFVSCSGHQLIIKNDGGKFKIEEEMSIATTTVDQSYQFNNACGSICHNCDPLLENSRGIVDSIRTEGLYLKYGTEFKYDTLPFMQARSMKKKERRIDLYKVIRNRPGILLVYKHPLEFRYEFIPLDSLTDVTYSQTEYCRKMAKMKNPFSKPNKINRASLQGAKKVKVK